MKKNIFIKGFFLVSLIFLFASCAQTVNFQNSSVVPAAQGKVKVEKDDNQNFRIEVAVRDLADIERLDSSRESYVVWMETRQGNTENLGQLVSSRSLLSKQKRATLETVTPFEPFRIFITAERGTNVRYPGNQVVLTTDTFNARR